MQKPSLTLIRCCAKTKANPTVWPIERSHWTSKRPIWYVKYSLFSVYRFCTTYIFHPSPFPNLEWRSGLVRARMYSRRPLPTGAMLSIGRLLLVRSRGYGQKYTGHIDQGRTARLCGQYNATNERLSRTEKIGISQRTEGIPSSSGCIERNHWVRKLNRVIYRIINIIKNLNQTYSGNQTKFGSEDEKVATLSFVLLDKNKNKMWERKEWKTFRELVTAARYIFVNGAHLICYSFLISISF